MTGAPLDWDAFYASLVADTGWTWDQVGRLTVPRFKALAFAWKKTPPLNRLLALALGVRMSESPRGDLAGLVRAMTGSAPPEW